MSKHGLLIRGARQLLTLRGPGGPRRGLALLDLGMIPDGAVLIHNGLISAVGASRQILNLARSRHSDEIDATGRVVMPAFVDATASVVQSRPTVRNFERLYRNYGSDDAEAFREAVLEGSRALASSSPKTLTRRATQTAWGMLTHGTTIVESRAPYGLDESAAVKILRVQKEQAEQGSLQIISSYLLRNTGSSAAQWTEHVCRELMPKLKRRKLAQVIDLEYQPRELPEEDAIRVLQSAAYLGFRFKVHAGFFAQSSAVPLALRCQAQAVELDRCRTRQDLEMLGRSLTAAILTPGVDLQTGLSQRVGGRAVLDAGVIPSLASGYHPELSPSYSMQMILLLASRLYRFTPEEAITAATINGAYAAGLAAEAGSIETGKQADLLILDVSDYRELAYHAGINVVNKVIKRGMLVYDSHVDAAAYGRGADLQLGAD